MGSDQKRKRSKSTSRKEERARRKKKKKDRRSRDRSRSPISGSSEGATRPVPASPPSPQHLLVAAAVGDRPRCRQLIEQGADVAYADGEGTTALHEACRHGHLPTARLLLRRGADAGLADARGDTPAHLAARWGHLQLLAALLQSGRPPATDAVNARGETVQDLADRAMDKEDVRSFRREETQQEAQQGPQHEAQQERQERSPSPVDPADDWQQRLAEELSGGEGEGEEYRAFGGGEWAADEYETHEEYARRIWEEMQSYLFRQEARTRAAFHRARRQEEARREAYRAAAEAESRRILEEQQGADAAWRAAVVGGQAGAKRAAYEARWQFFVSKPADAAVAYADVPWIVAAEGPPLEELQRVVLHGADGPEEQRRRLRTELVRWHPDKFVARFGQRLAEGDRERVLQRVNALSQQLNAIGAAIQQER